MGKQKRSALGEGLGGLLGRAASSGAGEEEALAAAEQPASIESPAARDPLWDAAAGVDAPAPAPPPAPAAVERPASGEAPALPAAGHPASEPVPSDEGGPEEGGTLIVEDMELLQSFIQESQDHLQTTEEKIITLESVKDLDIINEIFRCMHTMKGNSSFLGLVAMKELSHRLESVLDGLRTDAVALSPELVDVLLAGADTLLSMVGSLHTSSREALASGTTRATPFELELPHIEVRSLLDRINRILSGTAPAAAGPAATAGAGAPQAPGAPATDLVTTELVEKYASESADLLDEAERVLLELERQPEDPSLVDGAFRLIHTIKGNSGFMGFAEVESACMKTEALLESVRSGTRKASAGYISTLLDGLDTVRRAIAAAVPGAARGRALRG